MSPVFSVLSVIRIHLIRKAVISKVIISIVVVLLARLVRGTHDSLFARNVSDFHNTAC
jgi:hypothetical protein